jgi:hypothetical protein
LDSTDRMAAEDVLKFHPELQSFLDEIENKGWRYLYIEARGTSVAEIDLDRSPYKIAVADVYPRPTTASDDVYGPPDTNVAPLLLEVELAQKIIKLGGVPEVQMFRINVSTKSFPRAATVDIAKGVITYLNEAFWSWEETWKEDPKKLAEAREIHEVAEWLLEMKKQKLQENYSLDRYKEISTLLKERYPA